MQAGIFDMQKNTSEVTHRKNGEPSYQHNGEQSMFSYWCNVLPYICELCFMVRNGTITSMCCAGSYLVRDIPSHIFDPKSFLDPRSSHSICFGQVHFRQKGSDKNHTNLSPCRLGVLSGFVFTFDQICSEEYVIIGSMVRTHVSHGFGVYSCDLGVSKGMVSTTNTKIRINELLIKGQ